MEIEQEIQRITRGIDWVYVADWDGTATLQNSLDLAYRKLCGNERIDLYDHWFFKQGVITQRRHLELQVNDLYQQGLEHFYNWLDRNVQLAPGLTEFVETLQSVPGCTLLVASNNFDLFIERIMKNNGLYVPFLANRLLPDGRIETLHGEDGLDKGRVIDALIAAGIGILGVAGDSKSDWTMAARADKLKIPIAAFGKSSGQGDLGSWCHGQGIQATRVSDWRNVIPHIAPRLTMFAG